MDVRPATPSENIPQITPLSKDYKPIIDETYRRLVKEKKSGIHGLVPRNTVR